jgi:Raf kinase inhibitor-like YbhB/YbcL family protein
MTRLPLVLCFVSAASLVALGCSSGDDNGNPGTGGATAGSHGGAGAGGSAAGATGSAGKGGAGVAGSGPAGASGGGGIGGGTAGGTAGGAGGSGPGGTAGGAAGGAGGSGPGGSAAGSGGKAGGSAGGTGGGSKGGTGGGSADALTLTSSAFVMNGMIPTASTCASGNQGALPDLTWTVGPAATMSYAVVLTDLTNSLVHWVIWDIPAGTHMLPAALANTAMFTTPPELAGAKQKNFQSANAGYYGPCPSGQTHTYQFMVHAVDVATLPSVSGSGQTLTANLKTMILSHSIAMGELSGTSNAKSP